MPFAVKKNRALKMILSLPIALFPTVAFSLKEKLFKVTVKRGKGQIKAIERSDWGQAR